MLWIYPIGELGGKVVYLQISQAKPRHLNYQKKQKIVVQNYLKSENNYEGNGKPNKISKKKLIEK